MSPRDQTTRRRFRLPRSLRDLTGRELDEEIRLHLELRARQLEARGLSPNEARREAGRRFGSVEAVRREAHRRERTLQLREWLGDLAHDVRLALRGMRRSPTFTLAAILTLALGIGATTAIYTVVHAVLFAPLPYPEPGRIVMVWERDPAGERSNVGYATYEDVAKRNHSFGPVAAVANWQVTLTGNGPAERIEGQKVSWSFFRVFGVAPALGRDFTEADDRPGADRVAILSDSLWRTRFGADPDLVGRTIPLGGRPTTVVGILPAGFESLLAPDARIWRPLRYDDSLSWACRTCRHLRAVARLAPGATVAAADREMQGLSARLFAEHPTEYPDTNGHGMEVVGLQHDLTRAVRPALLALLGAVALVLLIACSNVSLLLVSRAAQRHGDLAIRAALGESRGRALRSLLVESLVLAAGGGLAGLGVALLGVRLLVHLSPPGVPRIDQVAADPAMLLVGLGLTLAAGLVFGLLPAAYLTRQRLWRRLAGAAGGRTVIATPRGQRTALVMAEVALTTVLLVGAGLLLQSLVRLLAVPPGFDTEGILTLQLEASGTAYSEDAKVNAFYHRVLGEVRAIPGVSSAALTSQLPLSRDFDAYGIHFRSHPRANPEEDPSAFRYAVSSGYLETLGLRLVRGRGFDARDFAAASGDEGGPHSVLISQALARRELGDADPIGQAVRIGSADEGPWRTIVGVVADTHQVSLAAESDAVYVPQEQWLWADTTRTLVVRARSAGGGPADLAALVPAIRARVRALDPDVPVTRVATMRELVSDSAARMRFALLLFALFAGVAVVLAAVGIFGVLAGVVAEREREIGVRTALGAGRSAVVGMIVGRGLRLSIAGAALGLAVSVGLSRFLQSLLFGVSHLDPATYGGVTVLLVAVALAACWVPARRAAGLDPVGALRAD